VIIVHQASSVCKILTLSLLKNKQMKGSLNLGRYWGIKLGIHWSFILLLAYVVYTNLSIGASYSDTLWYVLFVMVVFVCVTLHEFGHALAAKMYGIETKDITLLPIGGVARLEKMPEKPIQELVVAIAGPMVNFVISLFLLIYLLSFDKLHFPETEEELKNMFTSVKDNFWFILLSSNIILAVFNLIPAFPMDGGRIFRAGLSLFINRVTATQIASFVGQIASLGFIYLGFQGNPFMILIGIFIFFSARSEYTSVKTKSMMELAKVKDIMMTQYTLLKSNQTINEAISLLMSGQEKDFVVINDFNEPVGILSRENIIKAITNDGSLLPLSTSMETNIVAISKDNYLEEVYGLMLEKSIDILPVMENNQLIGVLNKENILEYMMLKKAGVDFSFLKFKD
jgi:Zn-dependent protease/predicted transcriptional regulator